MTAPYSIDLRERAMARKAAGETNRLIAAALGISPSCVSKWTRRQRETGSLAPAQIGGYKPRTLTGDCAQWLRERIASGPFTLRGLAAELTNRGDQDPSAGRVGVRSRRGLELQKKPCCPRSRYDLMWPASERAGRSIRAGSPRLGSCSSMKHGSRPTWRPCAAGGRAGGG